MNLTRSVVFALATLAVGDSLADVVRDGSVGPGVGVQPTGPNFMVDESMGSLVGPNLLHSFTSFSLSSVQSATFSAVSAVDNVVSRVTGGEASMINGLLQSTIPGVNRL